MRPCYRGEQGGEEVGLTELASKFCPLASCPCRWPTRFTKYPVRVISNLTPVRNDQSTVESPNGTNYSAKGTTHYSTKFGSLQSPILQITVWLTTTTDGTRVRYTTRGVHLLDIHRCIPGALETMLGNMMRCASHH